ncbi:1-acyl-sn-glycerol-3-phosphate acyltransferase [Acidiferrimicrobium sp. IK]|uniref:lysophospholipid acyltransferase family protein n=1 Tax=Acidiferrimicrobium sp. IK TaxID=2871700 RepID=UPI0021CB6DF6|nr:lysophospholipid acyltransferase family protein [Acidiferrimicrobium sp. IK]MCU4184096.1 1-acyl-sn-glycerol-3-phosphate acyltransferase [Acidiferrimicrobium sp. IK]
MGYTLIKMVLAPILRLAYRIKVEGREHLPAQGPVILAANHVSFLDNLVIPLISPRRVTFLAKAEYFDDKRVAWFFRLGGQIPIKREGGSAADRALASAREVLQAGGVLGIYPEGTRSPDGRLYKGRTGVARMALSCRAPVVPIGLHGTADAQPIGARFPRPFRTLTVAIGAPLRWDAEPGAEDDRDTLRRVTDEIVEAIAALSGQERVAHYAKRNCPDEPDTQAASTGSETPSAVTGDSHVLAD